jgi:alpha-L-fucosidase
VSNHQYKSVNSLIDDLVDIVSKNGCMLLNIGPKPDGTIPEPEQEMLLEMGAWLKVNGEAIYGSRPWQKYGEGPTEVEDGTMTNDAEKRRRDFGAEDLRFTVKGETLYVIGLEWPGDGATVNIRSLADGKGLDRVGTVTLLGHGGRLSTERDKKGLHVTLPEGKPCGFAYVLKIAR